jgi:ribosomal protein S18 acetylase RimI-like enzyme
MFPIAEMCADDYDEVLALWQRCEGVGLSPSDSQEGVCSFLLRNPGLSLVARQDDRIVGAVLCGHDGRRGYLYHLAVAAEWRRRGLGQALVEACLTRLAAAGIPKATIVVYTHNQDGQRFWSRLGWKQRADLVVLQQLPVQHPDAKG